MLYLRTQDELLVEVRARLRDGGGDRWSTSEVYQALNRSLDGWHGRVSVPAMYVISGGWPTDDFEITLPDWMPDEVRPQAQWPVDPLIPLDRTLSTWKNIANWVVEPAEDGTRTLRLSVVPYNATARLLFYVANGPVPVTLTTLNATIDADDTSLVLASVVNVAPVGYIKVDGEWLLYRGVTRGTATTTLENLVRAQYDTAAASHSSGATCYWGVGAPNNLVYMQLLDQTCAYMHELYLTHGAPRERDLHERMLSYFQAKADQFWRRHTSAKAPRWRPYIGHMVLLLGLLLLAGCGSVLISVEPLPFQYEPLAPLETPPPNPPTQPDSPLGLPLPAAVLLTGASPATFGLAELEQAAADLGITLVPGGYRCEFAGDDYARCELPVDGVPGGRVCVTADGAGACP